MFLSARVVTGKSADLGGTIIALLMLILLALACGKIIQMSSLLFKKCGFDLQMPPLLVMLIVGIFIKNVSYNFRQFGSAECASAPMSGRFLSSNIRVNPPKGIQHFNRHFVIKCVLNLGAEGGQQNASHGNQGGQQKKKKGKK